MGALFGISFFNGNAESLEFDYIELSPIHFDGHPFVEPLGNVNVVFKENIELTNNPSVFIVSNGEVVCTPESYDIYNFDNGKYKYGCLIANFNNELLPKGEKYSLRVSEGSANSIDNIERINNELIYEFEVPNDLGDGRVEAQLSRADVLGLKVICENNFTCYWGYEIKGVGNPQWELYRNGKLIKRLPLQVGSDWNLGYACFLFEEGYRHDKLYYFEDGIEYQMVIPEGCIRTYRDDIVNKEVSFSFIGGYSKSSGPLEYSDYTLEYNGLNSQLGKVVFTYNEPIMLSLSPSIELRDETNNMTVKEANLSIKENEGCWKLIGDFDDFVIDTNSRYSLIISEATIVTKEGDILVNAEQRVALDQNSRIQTHENTTPSFRIINGQIIVYNFEPCEVELYSCNGELMAYKKGFGKDVILHVRHPGIYILRINGRNYKIKVC